MSKSACAPASHNQFQKCWLQGSVRLNPSSRATGGYGDPTTLRSHRARRPDATSRLLNRDETDGFREWEHQFRRAGGDAEPWIRRRWLLESRIRWEL
jgi:hypothetical protein